MHVAAWTLQRYVRMYFVEEIPQIPCGHDKTSGSLQGASCQVNYLLLLTLQCHIFLQIQMFVVNLQYDLQLENPNTDYESR